MTVWGLLVGLVFLPVLLSMFGPVGTVHARRLDITTSATRHSEPPLLRASSTSSAVHKKTGSQPSDTVCTAAYLNRSRSDCSKKGLPTQDTTQRAHEEGADDVLVNPAHKIIEDAGQLN